MANRNKNPKDATWPLFKKLTRLFSGPLINYRTQTTRQLSRINTAVGLKMLQGKNFKGCLIILLIIYQQI